MVIRNIDLGKLDITNLIATKFDMSFYKIDGLFYKVMNSRKNIPLSKRAELGAAELTLDLLEGLGLGEMNEVCAPLEKLYHYDKFVGYTTTFLDGYTEFIIATKKLDCHKKIALLIELSKTVKKLHQRNILHTDLYSDNVLSNGNDIKIIDFDESNIFNEGNMVSFFNSPYADIAEMNDLILRTLIIPTNAGTYDNDNPISLPRDIKDYISRFDVNDERNCNGLIKAVMPSEYPHDWLNNLENYIGVDGYLQRNR